LPNAPATSLHFLFPIFIPLSSDSSLMDNGVLFLLSFVF
jgi:hypothetical protein